MEYQKGDGVRNTKTKYEGVISYTPTEKGFIYVQWIHKYNELTKEVIHWVEFVSQEDLEFIPIEKMNPAVMILHRNILR